MYKVVRQNPDNKRDILFEVDKDSKPTLEMEKFKQEIERVLIVLRELYSESDQLFDFYYDNLLKLAQVGLISHKIDIAYQALKVLKEEVVIKEGGKIKNKYMKMLGTAALKVGLLPLVIAIIAVNVEFYNKKDFVILINFLFLWSGSMVGIWLSFGVRKTDLSFYDLHVLEKDRLNPYIRLFFAGFMTITIGLFLSLDFFELKVCNITSSLINSNIRFAILLGIVCGISEKALPSKVTQHAYKLLNVKNNNE